MSAATGKEAPAPSVAWPGFTYETVDLKLYNSEPVIIHHLPAAHTDGDSIVFFRGSDVVSTGELFTPTHYPVIDVEKGGTVQGTIDALNDIIDLLVPREYEEGGTYVIPGPRARMRSERSLELPRHGDDYSRSHSGHAEKGDDARSSESGEAHT